MILLIVIVLCVGALYICWHQTLERKIARRQRRAEKKHIRSRAEFIVGVLVNARSSSSFYANSGTYSDGQLVINLSEGNVSIRIKSTNETVFSEDTYVGGRLEGYIPGAWETHFDELYRKAEQARKALLVSERESRKRQFGL